MTATKIYYERKKSLAQYENHTAGIEIHLDPAACDTEAAAMDFAKGFVARVLGDAGREPLHARPGRSGSAGDTDIPRQSNVSSTGQRTDLCEIELPSPADLERFMERMYELGDAARKTRPEIERAIKCALSIASLKTLEQAPADWVIRVKNAAESGGFDFKTGEIKAMETVA